jgi:hypothetical protein
MKRNPQNQNRGTEGQFVIFEAEVVESENPVEQAGATEALKKVFHIKKNVISVEQFQSHLIDFLNNIQTVLSSCNTEFKGFSMDTVQVSAEISAEGQIGFMGTHVGVGGKGGITFGFKKV